MGPSRIPRSCILKDGTQENPQRWGLGGTQGAASPKMGSRRIPRMGSRRIPEELHPQGWASHSFLPPPLFQSIPEHPWVLHPSPVGFSSLGRMAQELWIGWTRSHPSLFSGSLWMDPALFRSLFPVGMSHPKEHPSVEGCAGTI